MLDLCQNMNKYNLIFPDVLYRLSYNPIFLAVSFFLVFSGFSRTVLDGRDFENSWKRWVFFPSISASAFLVFLINSATFFGRRTKKSWNDLLLLRTIIGRLPSSQIWLPDPYISKLYVYNCHICIYILLYFYIFLYIFISNLVEGGNRIPYFSP